MQQSIEAPAPPLAGPPSKGRLYAEIVIVLGLSLGLDGIEAIIQLIDLSTRTTSLGSQSVALNTSVSDRPFFDFTYQLLGMISELVPVALVMYIMWQLARPHLARLGFDFRRPALQAGAGILLALVIGAGGIGVYLGARALGLAANVSASSLPPQWWAFLLLVLSALTAALQEEFIVIGYLYSRLRQLGWKKWWIILAAAALRGSYHLYQGYGGFVGNFIMGVIFGWLYYRFGRLLPFVIAHFLIDAATFIGYPWAHATFPHLF